MGLSDRQDSGGVHIAHGSFSDGLAYHRSCGKEGSIKKKKKCMKGLGSYGDVLLPVPVVTTIELHLT